MQLGLNRDNTAVKNTNQSLTQLPLEIRRIIYYDVFFGNGIICQISGASFHTKIGEKQHAIEERPQVTAPLTSTKSVTLRSNIDALSLLLVSRQM